ncbi:type II toxin-antitoxin system RelE/ParE family toxin [Rhizobium sp. 25PS6]|uniref:type II toxin-antitoxin system RelE/ParE family toxin n=1 Tax=unclassified Rhizobium TaxID=2613769 RepID=UPI0028FD0240|nr:MULTISPECIES: type II toxin-antitoxin system RelE/ParE family toxin [unclassified Rhizobium]MDU0307577.1 type II toxin-antitoxin system RelE/ParE family toxin [Rhizobium sp. 10PS4]MDU0364394.1 type II toxin-antitoxin system RelE/ParE family toxin [Rhizobium sp. 25PS6]
MRRAKVINRPEALSDLRQIYIDIADMSRSHVIANGFVKRLMARCHKIGDAPNGGRPRDDLAPGLRTVPFEHCAVIAYHVTDAVEIVNVFYGGRDYEALFRARDDEDES